MPASGPNKNFKMFPAAVLDDQEAIMAKEFEPVVFGPPPFSSPDPETDGIRMEPVSGSVAELADEDKKAGDWVDAVKAAGTQEDLDAVAERYSESGADFKSVNDAIEKKQDELNEA